MDPPVSVAVATGCTSSGGAYTFVVPDNVPDAAFAFAVTLLVVSIDFEPTNVGELVEAEAVAKHQGRAEDLGARVGDSLAGDVRRRAPGRLVQSEGMAVLIVLRSEAS